MGPITVSCHTSLHAFSPQSCSHLSMVLALTEWLTVGVTPVTYAVKRETIICVSHDVKPNHQVGAELCRTVDYKDQGWASHSRLKTQLATPEIECWYWNSAAKQIHPSLRCSNRISAPQFMKIHYQGLAVFLPGHKTPPPLYGNIQWRNEQTMVQQVMQLALTKLWVNKWSLELLL